MTGMGDSTLFSIFNTVQPSEQTVLQVGHGMALGNDGLRLSGDLTYAWSKPGIGGLPLSSETMIATAALAYPLARRQVHTLLATRSEEHTSELQSLMRISYAVFCLKQKKN